MLVHSVQHPQQARSMSMWSDLQRSVQPPAPRQPFRQLSTSLRSIHRNGSKHAGADSLPSLLRSFIAVSCTATDRFWWCIQLPYALNGWCAQYTNASVRRLEVRRSDIGRAIHVGGPSPLCLCVEVRRTAFLVFMLAHRRVSKVI